MTRVPHLLVAAFASLLLFALPAAAGALNLDTAGVAVGGYDPVAYFSQSQAVEGSDALTATHDGATYRFASAENKAAFEADPEKFLPAYGGYCAYGMSQGYKAPIDPQAFTIVDDKLYLNYSLGVRKTWQSDIPGYVAKADKVWSEIGG
ncbi:MAG: YHS domain-containing (seleno)protein [Rhizobiaceae bacterium]